MTVNTQTMQPAAAIPRQEKTQSSDQRSKITFWAGQYEGFLYLNAKPATYERYARVLSKFIGHFPEKKFVYEFLRADVEDYKQLRLSEGASPTTVGIELSVIRGFFDFMLRMDAEGAMLNPGRGVRVERSYKRQVVEGSAHYQSGMQDTISER